MGKSKVEDILDEVEIILLSVSFTDLQEVLLEYIQRKRLEFVTPQGDCA